MYIGMFVQLHGLAEGDMAAVKQRVYTALDQEFKPVYASDIDVDIEESAGAPGDQRSELIDS